jgi:hypothetical protein
MFQGRIARFSRTRLLLWGDAIQFQGEALSYSKLAEGELSIPLSAGYHIP